MAVDWYADRLAEVRSRPNPTEADVSDNLVRPVLERVLEFRVSQIDAQPTDTGGAGRRRPDFVCRRNRHGAASAIIEVKRLGTHLIQRSADSWSSSPLGQLQNYLNRYRGSTDGTWGILTNGTRWLVIRRDGERVSPYDEIPMPPEIETLGEIEKILRPVRESLFPLEEDIAGGGEQDWLEAVSSCMTPAEFIRKVSPPPLLLWRTTSSRITLAL